MVRGIVFGGHFRIQGDSLGGHVILVFATEGVFCILCFVTGQGVALRGAFLCQWALQQDFGSLRVGLHVQSPGTFVIGNEDSMLGAARTGLLLLFSAKKKQMLPFRLSAIDD